MRQFVEKSHAAYALGWLGTRGDKNSIQSLIGALTNKDVRVRGDVVAALGRLGDSSVLEPLKKLAINRAEDLTIRGNAYVALGNLGLPTAQETLQAGTKESDAFLSKCAQEGLRLLRTSRPDPAGS